MPERLDSLSIILTSLGSSLNWINFLGGRVNFIIIPELRQFLIIHRGNITDFLGVFHYIIPFFLLYIFL